jgi:hypothetical protein
MEQTNVAANYWVSFFTFMAGLSVNEWVALGGLMIGVATFLTNFWFKREHLKIARQNINLGE